MKEGIEPILFVGLVAQGLLCVFRPIAHGLGEAKWTGYGVLGFAGASIIATSFCEETLLARSCVLLSMS